MDGNDAMERIRDIRCKVNAICRIKSRLDGDIDFADDIAEIAEIQYELEAERNEITDKLSRVQI